jgi:hypothetical protein
MKTDKPKDYEESWLRKMTDRMRLGGSQSLATEDPEEVDDTEDDSEAGGPSERNPDKLKRKLKKKRKKDEGIFELAGPFIVLALAVYGAWKLLAAVFG